jgi:hypothetical protein
MRGEVWGHKTMLILPFYNRVPVARLKSEHTFICVLVVSKSEHTFICVLGVSKSEHTFICVLGVSKSEHTLICVLGVSILSLLLRFFY